MIKLKNLDFQKLGILSFLLVLLFTGCNQKDSAQWRGLNRDGIYNETNLLDTWDEGQIKLLWEYNGIGKGYAAPSVTKDKLFVNAENEGNSFLFAFDLKGNLLWKAANGKEFMGEGFSATYPGARATPTVVGNLVYTTSGMGRIACFETTTGIEKWAVDIVKDFGGTVGYFGYSESLVVNDDKVYCFAGGEKNNMLALDRFTGKTVWASEALKDTFSYCSPILVETPVRKMLITHSKHNLLIVDCKNGKVLSSHKLLNVKYDGDHCNSPIYSNGFIYFIVDDNDGSGALKLDVSENGENLQEVWSNLKIRNNFGGLVKIGNGLFTTIKGNWLKKLDEQTGSVLDSIKVAAGSLIYADDKFICYGMNGDVNLINYQDNKFEIGGSFKVKKGTGQHFSHPVISNGVLYIRHGDSLLAYKVK